MLFCGNVFCLFNITLEYYVFGITTHDTFNTNPLACNNISIYFIHGILGEVTMNLNNKFQASTKALISELWKAQLYYSWYEQLYIKQTLTYFYLAKLTVDIFQYRSGNFTTRICSQDYFKIQNIASYLGP